MDAPPPSADCVISAARPVQACCKMVGLIQRTTNYWLLQHGFSIGIGDTVADDRTMAVRDFASL